MSVHRPGRLRTAPRSPAPNETRYASANLTWTPSAPWLLGVELLYGSREDKDGTKASVVRTQLVSRLSF